MWACHITGRQDAALPCAVSLYTAHRQGILSGMPRVTICIISERLPERPRQLPLHSLTAEAEGGNLCCSRTTAVPSSPSQRTPQPRTKWVNGLPTMPAAAYLAAEASRQPTGPGREPEKTRVKNLHFFVFPKKLRHKISQSDLLPSDEQLPYSFSCG